jgi:hypothetical protein
MRALIVLIATAPTLTSAARSRAKRFRTTIEARNVVFNRRVNDEPFSPRGLMRGERCGGSGLGRDLRTGE